MRSPNTIGDAPFALRITQRRGGKAAIVYRRAAGGNGHDELLRLADLPPLAFRAALPMLRNALEVGDRFTNGATAPDDCTSPGPYRPIDDDWGPRVACYAIITAGLVDGNRMLRAAQYLRQADANQAAWWLGLLQQGDSVRALRALRILTEAVQ